MSEQLANVDSNGPLSDTEFASDLLIVVSKANKTENVILPLCERKACNTSGLFE